MSAACSGVLLVLLIVTSFLADILWPAEWGEPATVRAGDRLAIPVIIEPIRGDLTGPITAQGDDLHQFSIGQQFRMVVPVILHETDPERVLIQPGEDGVYGTDAIFGTGIGCEGNVGEDLCDLLLQPITFHHCFCGSFPYRVFNVTNGCTGAVAVGILFVPAGAGRVAAKRPVFPAQLLRLYGGEVNATDAINKLLHIGLPQLSAVG